MTDFSYLFEVLSSYYSASLREKWKKMQSEACTPPKHQNLARAICAGVQMNIYENKIFRNGYSQYCCCSGGDISLRRARVCMFHTCLAAYAMPACRTYSQLSAVKIYVGRNSYSFFFLLLISFRRGTLYFVSLFESLFHFSFICIIFCAVGCLVVRIQIVCAIFFLFHHR